MTAEILNHLWQSTAFAAVCSLLALALRNHRAHIRYALWVAASVKFLIPFELLSTFGRMVGEHLLPPIAAPATIVVELVARPSLMAVRPADTSALSALLESPGPEGLRNAMLLVAVIWAIGTSALTIRWVLEWRRLARIAGRAAVVSSGREFEILRRLEQRRRTGPPTILLASDESMEPGVFGLFRARLLWPRGISAHLDDAQVEAIVAHELSHVARHDNLIAMAQMVVQAVFWFHPLVWWIGARLIDERERACDEDVLHGGSEPDVYAESILRTCRFSVESPLACAAGVTGSDLKRRIESIMSPRVIHRLGATKKALISGVAAAAVIGPVVVGLVDAPRVHAQIGELRIGEQRFEVASVKPNESGERNGMLRRQPGGRVTGTNMPLRQLINFAYQLKPMMLVGGPGWIDDARFDISAKTEGDSPPAPPGSGPDGLMLAMRSLLADRFKLDVHRETRELDVYALVLARSGGKPGPQLRPSTQDCSPAGVRATTASGSGAQPPAAIGDIPRCGVRMGNGRLLVGGMPLAALTGPLGMASGRIVVDQTGLTGGWDVELTFAANAARGLPPAGSAPDGANSNAPSVFTAVQEQLELKLQSTKAPIEILVIDRVERPTQD